ncbi:PTS fructose transporter subunit IIBC [Jinshanibacter sp. LJY008]|uniref:PTS fructose transporter subunit IIBC n=1 Tax=Limnobaculum eriocheiris TaxID=2897391 RepID=A0A9X1MUX2_9GAMM|nr:PTS fructose transporter subunit IIBC [Limnobaculum eriocheiris]MCD1125409.1 PTS fructose transporter subunit IIBC [Limnobaculum eriocheiris]
MKTLILSDNSLGQAVSHLAKFALTASMEKAGLTQAEALDQAELVIVVGDSIPEPCSLENKKVWQGNAQAAISHPEEFLYQAIANADFYHSSQTNNNISSQAKRIVAVTACPTGVAHTFMAAEAIETEAKKRGWEVKVETRGSVGAGNAITPEEVAQADLVIVAADIEVDLSKFAGKPMYRTSTGLALKKTAQELDKAVQQAQIFTPQQQSNNITGNKKESTGPYRHLLTGVSYMLPMVVAGGLCIALSFVFGITAFEQQGTLAAALMDIGGKSAFALMVPILAGYIAFSIADRPGLTPGLIGGMLAVSTGAGFLGGIIAGFLAGYVALFISNKLYLPKSLSALKPILIIPLVASLVTGLVMIYVVGTPVAKVLAALTQWLKDLGTADAVMLGAILGAMMCTDMGGPINKASYAFGVTLLSTKIYAPMAAIMAAGMVPPLAMGLATLLAARKFTKNEQDGGKAALVLGLSFITEGAIPFAAKDPMRVIPCCMAGGALTGALSMMFGAELTAPHGGLFVLLIPGAVEPVIGYLIAIIAGAVVTGVTYAVIKRPEIVVSEGVMQAA